MRVCEIENSAEEVYHGETNNSTGKILLPNEKLIYIRKNMSIALFESGMN